MLRGKVVHLYDSWPENVSPNSFTREVDRPDFVPELGQLDLICGIELELGLGIYDHTGLETTASKHYGR